MLFCAQELYCFTLSYWRGTALLPFDPPAGQVCFQNAYQLFRERHIGRGAFLAWSAIVDLICLEWADFSQLDRWLDETQSLRAEFGAPADELAAHFAASMFGALLFRWPQDPAIHQWAERLLLLIEACPDANQRILLGCNLQVHYNVAVGLNVELDRLMKAIEPPSGTPLSPLAGALLAAIRSMHYWNRGQSEKSAEAAASGARLAHENGMRMWDFLLGALQAYAWLNNGDLSRGRAVLARLEKCLDRKRRVDVAHFHYLAGLASLLADEGESALRHIESGSAIASRYGGPQQHALDHLAHAQALHAVGRGNEAWPFLARGREIGLAMRSHSIGFQADLCEAYFALDEGDEGDDGHCASALRRAFATGAAQDYLNHNYFRPAIMARLCAFALAHGISPDYARRLIRKRGLKPLGSPLDCWPWPVRVFTLGRFTVVVEGQALAESSRVPSKPFELLQALLALGGRQVAIPLLIDSLWPDAECKGGRGAFDVNLSRLRRLLGQDDALLVEAGRLTLNPELCWVDLWSFERLLNGAQANNDASEQADIAALLGLTDGLLRLYQGDFLGREEARWWALPLRESLRSRLGRTLGKLGGMLAAGGQLEQAARLYERAIEIEPLAELPYRRLMALLHQQGEIAEGLRVYFRCRQALAMGLGASPSSATEAIRSALDEAAESRHSPSA